MTRNPFSGAWRILWMSAWDQDVVDMDVPGHFTFGPSRSGHFQFGLVQGDMDCHLGKASKVPRLEFTWQGFDEGDEVAGRGHVEIVDGELQGHLYFHLGDDSAFRAVRPTPAPRKRKND